MITRLYEPLDKKLAKGKVLILYGPRRVGKSTLLKNLIKSTSLKWRMESGDDISVRQLVGSQSIKTIGEYVEGYDLIIIDEAQNIPQIGNGLKIMTDHFPKLKIVVTGSSSFDLSNKVGEPLVGRQHVYTLFPISQGELSKMMNRHDLKKKLDSYLVYGSYPEAITLKTLSAKKDFLHHLVNAYLLKDILALESIKSSRTLQDLLRLLAYQVGSEVSLNELATKLKIDVKTVGRYLDLLEKSFIIISLSGLSRNLRSEVTSKKKYYFYDCGIRNALINNYNPIAMRNDVGQLWENFMFMEFMKKMHYHKIYSHYFFWRTYSQSEIDLIEDRNGKLQGYEFKWGDRKFKTPNEWISAYPGSRITCVTPENYLDFIL